MNRATLPALLAAMLTACNGGSEDPDAAQAQAQATAAPTEKLAAVQPELNSPAAASSSVRDPGPRPAPVAAGQPLPGLTALQLAAFETGKEDFSEAEGAEEGLGPTMNLDSCAGCHQQPGIGGSSPPINPQIAFASKLSATNTVPSFLSLKGPIREARFIRNSDGSPDGGVHSLFTIAGRSDAAGCAVRQPDFAAALASRNIVFRIPTPVFGAGLIEQIPDREILANMASQAPAKAALGIRGRGNVLLPAQAISAQPNKNGNDGTLGRFGWKAQNKSLLVFSGEAYNVEMGITNELFPTERDETEACNYATQPNSAPDLAAATPLAAMSSIDKFSVFMRLLAPPQPSADVPGGSTSINSGKALFSSVGCALCHTPVLGTGNTTIAAMRYKEAKLYSDLLLHDMGVGLADGITQGQANGREFRTAPLWGLGQRLFFMHDGRTADLRQALAAHQSAGSEANGVINRYNRLTDSDKQDLLNFLRSL